MCHVKCLFCMYFMNYTRRPLLHSRMDAYPIAVQGCNWVTRVYVNYLNKARVFAEVERTEPIHTQFDVVTRQTFFFLLIHSSLHRFMCWSLKVYLNLLSTTIWGQRFCVHKRIRENIFFFFFYLIDAVTWGLIYQVGYCVTVVCLILIFLRFSSSIQTLHLSNDVAVSEEILLMNV